MALWLDIEENLPEPVIYDISKGMEIPVHRVGNFYPESTGPGCGKHCLWNGGGYYMDQFVCGTTYPSGKTFYCCNDCYRQAGNSTKVFISYRWNDPGITDDFTALALGRGIEVIRDIREIGFMDAISSFMETAGNSRYFIAIMTKEYFYSRYCMFELSVLNGSTEVVRTIPVLLNQPATTEAEDAYCAYWEHQYKMLLDGVSQLDAVNHDYLQKELALLKSFPGIIRELLGNIRQKKLPDGDYWLSNHCRYLLGAINTTFKPTDDDAVNWTFSGRQNRADRIYDGKTGKAWQAVPFYLHATSDEEAFCIQKQQGMANFLLGVFHETKPVSIIPPGNHIIVITGNFLRSELLCTRLITMSRRKDVVLIPVFADATLRPPGSEVAVLLYWNKRYQQLVAEKKISKNILLILGHLGKLIAGLRDRLVPGIL